MYWFPGTCRCCSTLGLSGNYKNVMILLFGTITGWWFEVIFIFIPIFGEYTLQVQDCKNNCPLDLSIEISKTMVFTGKTLQNITYGIPRYIYVYDLFWNLIFGFPAEGNPVRGNHASLFRSSAWSFKPPPWPPNRPGRRRTPSTMEPRTLPRKRPKAWSHAVSSRVGCKLGSYKGVF